LVVGDFDADGTPDIATANPGSNTLTVLFGKGDGTFPINPSIPAANGLGALATGTSRSGGLPGLIAAYPAANNVAFLPNAGNWAGPTYLKVSGFPSTTTAGVAQSFTVTVENSLGQTLTKYTGTVHFTSNDPQAALPAPYTFTASDAGVHTFSAALKTADTESITATDASNAQVNGSELGITVNPAAMSQFGVIYPSSFNYTSPQTTITSGHEFAFDVRAEDAYGNLVTNYTGTVHFTSSDSQAVLPADTTISPTNSDIATVLGTLVTVGTQTITVTDTVNASFTGTGSFSVGPWANVTGYPSVASLNQSVSFTLMAGGGGLPPGTVFSWAISWRDGNSQTITGTSPTTVSHTYTTIGEFAPAVAATVNGITGASTETTGTGVFPYRIEPDPANPGQYALVVQGTTAKDDIWASPGSGNGIFVSFGPGFGGNITAPGGVAFAHLIIYGGGGADDVGLLGGLAVPALVFADGTLDASGSIANNILVGQGGNDTLQGGGGRDILIAGTGAGTLEGGSGGDILIGGYTSYDGNITALLAIMAEWGRTDADYNTRIAHLMGTQSGGLNGSYFLNSSTVFDNGLIDVLTGGAGMDWFFAHTSKKNGDTIQNLNSGEVVTTI
jgi:hypothetical protein